MLYVGMTTTNVRTRFGNHRSCIKNYKRNILLYDHFCGPGHEISDCKAQIIFHLETDDNDAKDVLLAKEEYYMRMLSTLYPFGLKDNVNSLNTNIKTYNFKQFSCLNTPFFSYAQPRKKRSHGHRKKKSSQTALDFISQIKTLYTAREHRTLYTLLRSVSHQYTIYHIASACNSIRIELYQIFLEFNLQFCEPKKAQTILCISLYHLSTRCRKKWTSIVFWIVKMWSHNCLYKPRNSRYKYHTNMGLLLGRLFSTTIKYSPHFQWARMVICLLVTVNASLLKKYLSTQHNENRSQI